MQEEQAQFSQKRHQISRDMKPAWRFVLIVCSKICNLLSYDSTLLTLAGFTGGEVQELMDYDAGISTFFPEVQSIELRDDAHGSIGLHSLRERDSVGLVTDDVYS